MYCKEKNKREVTIIKIQEKKKTNQNREVKLHHQTDTCIHTTHQHTIFLYVIMIHAHIKIIPTYMCVCIYGTFLYVFVYYVNTYIHTH